MYRIGLVVPEGSGTFQADAERIAAQLGVVPVFCAGHFAGAIPMVQKMLREHSGIQALISRAVTAAYLRRSFDLPVVGLNLDNFDFARAISALPDKSGRFMVVQFNSTALTFDVEAIASVCGIDLQTVFVEADQPNDYNRIVEEHGCTRVVCSVAVVAEPCRRGGKEIISLPFSPDAIRSAMQQAVYLIESKRKEAQRTEQLIQILNAFSEGFLAVDQQGCVATFNRALCDIVGVRPPGVIGASLEEAKAAIPFLRALTEAADESVLEFHGSQYIVNKPVFEENGLLRGIWCVSSLTGIQKKSTIYQNKLVKNGYRAKHAFADMVSVSPVMEEVKDRAKRYAKTDCNILILGESGTGKEMLAQSIHNESEFRYGPFVAINCAALPESLLESELFGYEDGAFTGARRGGKAGLIELSDHGTLFLDEVGLMPPSLQAKLLRSLQERQISRVGGARVISVENRLICATNNDLAKAVREGTFRADLFYRLDVLTVRLPPLRDRTGDIPFLVRTLLRRKGLARQRIMTIDNGAMRYFASYGWPGNFRQLDAVLERIFALTQGHTVPEELLQKLFEELPSDGLPCPAGEAAQSGPPLVEGGGYLVSGSLPQMEEQIFREAYRRCGGDVAALPQSLGIGRTTLWRKLKQYGLRNSAPGE